MMSLVWPNNKKPSEWVLDTNKPTCHCLICGHIWYNQVSIPSSCPSCRSTKWNRGQEGLHFNNVRPNIILELRILKTQLNAETWQDFFETLLKNQQSVIESCRIPYVPSKKKGFRIPLTVAEKRKMEDR
jgi:hypothetical protein